MATRRLRQIARLTALTAACSVWSASADAQTKEQAGWFGGVGLYFGAGFGMSKGFEWGLEGFVFRDYVTGGEPYDSCRPRGQTLGVGPLLQYGGISGDAPRFSLTGHALYTFRSGSAGYSIAGELGPAYFSHQRIFALHTGLVLLAPYFNMSARHFLLANQTSTSLGVRTYPGVNGDHVCMISGRPLRTDAALGATRRKRGESESPSAHHWSSQAAAELESVPAFVNLAAQLLAVNAPDRLIERALDAAEDEARHAVTCHSLAKASVRNLPPPRLPSSWHRTPLVGEAGLLRLATESWVDGVLNEGLAARIAVDGGVRAQSPEIRSALQRIGRDEMRHYALAGDILSWACARSLAAQELVAATLEPTGLGPPPGDDRTVDGGLDRFQKERLWDEHLSSAQQVARSVLHQA